MLTTTVPLWADVPRTSWQRLTHSASALMVGAGFLCDPRRIGGPVYIVTSLGILMVDDVQWTERGAALVAPKICINKCVMKALTSICTLGQWLEAMLEEAYCFHGPDIFVSNK